MGESKNIIVAIALSLLFMFGYNEFYLGPKLEKERLAYEEQQKALEGSQIPGKAPTDPAKVIPGQKPASSVETGGQISLADALSETTRLKISTPELIGSLSLRGAIIDDLQLVNHKVEKDSEDLIRLLTPMGIRGEKAYYTRFGWVDSNLNSLVPENALWTSNSTELTPTSPVTLSYVNAEGIEFIQTISVDDKFMFTVEQTINNNSTADVAASAYGLVERQGPIETDGMFILHEGLIAGLSDEANKTLIELDYEDAATDPINQETTGGWLGITDKYWMTVLVPDQKTVLPRAAMSQMGAAYGAEYFNYVETVKANESATVTNRFYAGAKDVPTIRQYQEDLGVEIFIDSVDWGWFHFITYPFYVALHFLFGLVGNFGVAIILFTIVIKLALFPLANKQYVSMAHMKKVQPQIKKMQERYKDDRAKLQQEMMALYKKEKINPMAGCLPIFIQIPIFFSLYKVLYVTIDMRHQPFFGWITDLSAPDPLTPLNLFGLIPWDPPSLIAVGIWPILMGVSMWAQQKMNPTTMAPEQQKIMNMLPIIFTFILANFAAGLVIYWTWNAILSVAQQYVITRREEAKG
ncbi:membrane protein insertase YidC [Temperatibacter marinus]|uniref:Membrane protein insertase YidC n=1 Tax=Temperatibacter marinus TaxID=1456591 RepID=A0AA52EI76_9PROT|nr:membrane protein insertase YidC [Temperatibacter marinus]WND04108.1 membrane protein insertase YidC [Temperatibacter marinus]